MLRTDGLGFAYRSKKVLRDVDMEVGKGEIVALLGPNGVGKTTLMKCVCSILQPTEGSLSIHGMDIRDIPLRNLAKYTAYVPQRAPRIHSTVIDYVLIGRRPYINVNVTDHDMEVVWNVVNGMSLDHLAVKYLDTLSGGEFQKVQIARALVQEAGILLLDEPTSNLDVSNAYETMHMIRDIVRSRGVSVMMIAHDLNMAIHISDRLLFMKDGTIWAEGGTDIVTEDLIREVYGIGVRISDATEKPYVLPRD